MKQQRNFQTRRQNARPGHFSSLEMMYNFVRSILALATALLCAGTAHAQDTGSTDVTIMSPVTVQNDQEMNFGNIIPGTILSRLRINPNTGVLVVNRGDATPAGGTVSRALFTITGDPNERIRITLSQRRINLVRVGGTETMRLNRFRLDGRRNRRLDNSGSTQFAVGGQLRVTANQAGGVYEGSFELTVDYF